MREWASVLRFLLKRESCWRLSLHLLVAPLCLWASLISQCQYFLWQRFFTLVFGVPAALVLRAKNKLTFFYIVGTSFFIGAFPAIFVCLAIILGGGDEIDAVFGVLPAVVVLGGFGAIAGLTWYVIAPKYGRDTKASDTRSASIN